MMSVEMSRAVFHLVSRLRTASVTGLANRGGEGRELIGN